MTDANASVLSVRRASWHGRAEIIDWRYARVIRRRIAVVKSNAKPSSAMTVRAAMIQCERSTKGDAMAGQPIKKAVQITALEQRMAGVTDRLRDRMPARYAERSPQSMARDPLGTAWREAMLAVENADDFVGDLGELLREKAGLSLEEARARIAESKEAPASAETVPAGD